jgi:hypothetical protein
MYLCTMTVGSNLYNIQSMFGKFCMPHECSEPKFLNIDRGLKSRLFDRSSLFKGQRVQQSSNRLKVLCVN